MTMTVALYRDGFLIGIVVVCRVCVCTKPKKKKRNQYFYSARMS